MSAYRITTIHQDREQPGMFSITQTSHTDYGVGFYEDSFPVHWIWGLGAARFAARTRFRPAQELREELHAPVPDGEVPSDTATTGYRVEPGSPLALAQAAWNAANEARWAAERQAQADKARAKDDVLRAGIAACSDSGTLSALIARKVHGHAHTVRMREICALLGVPAGEFPSLARLRELLGAHDPR